MSTTDFNTRRHVVGAMVGRRAFAASPPSARASQQPPRTSPIAQLVFTVVVALLLLQTPSQLRAQEDDYAQGVAALEAGDLPSAVEHFRAAVAEAPNQQHVLALAASLQEGGRFTESIQLYEALLQGEFGPLPAAARDSIGAAMETARNQLATLRIHTNAENTELDCDGESVGSASPDRPLTLRLDPGPHVVRGQSPGHSAVSQRLQLRSDENHQLHLSLAVSGPEVPTRTLELQTETTTPTGGWVLLGASAVPLIVGSVTGLLVQSRINDARQAPSHMESQGHLSDARQLRGWSYGAFALAGVMVVASTIWLLTGRRTSEPSLALRF